MGVDGRGSYGAARDHLDRPLVESRRLPAAEIRGGLRHLGEAMQRDQVARMRVGFVVGP